LYVAHLNLAGDVDNFRPQIELRMITVEAIEQRHERGGNDKNRIGKLIWIANHQTGPPRVCRGHEIKIVAKAWQILSHASIVRGGTARSSAANFFGSKVTFRNAQRIGICAAKWAESGRLI